LVLLIELNLGNIIELRQGGFPTNHRVDCRRVNCMVVEKLTFSKPACQLGSSSLTNANNNQSLKPPAMQQKKENKQGSARRGL
jgi:hypothetical protein